MNAIIAELPKSIPNAHVISSSGCKARPDRLHFTPEGYRELGKRYGEKMLTLLGHKVPESKQPEPAGPTPATYCNPISLPNYPLGRRARDATVGTPVPKDDWLWLVDRQQQFRELADVSVLWHEGAWYMYPSVDMAWVSKDGGATWRHADTAGLGVRMACAEAGLSVRQCLVWVKSVMVLGRQDYQWRHEPCLYGWADGAAHTWLSDRAQTTVLEFDKPARSTDHPTTKPVDLFAYLIGNSCKPVAPSSTASREVERRWWPRSRPGGPRRFWSWTRGTPTW